MKYHIKRVDEFDLKDQRVFLRVDFNVPMENGKITDDTRIKETLPTIKYLIEHGAKVILGSHLGRPKAGNKKEFSLSPIAEKLSSLLNFEVLLMENPTGGEGFKNILSQLKPNQIILLENLRFESGEEKNSQDLAMQWAKYTDIYINDAFGACHRAHASIVALPSFVSKRGMGFLIDKELKMLSHLIEKPDHPYAALLGGAKVSDKIGVIEKLMDLVDLFLVGGAMSYTFLSAQGIPVGKSRIEKDKLNFAKEMLNRVHARDKKLLLPIDHVVAKSIDNLNDVKTVHQIPDDWMALDIGPQTQELFSSELTKCKTIFWNGPMGVFEKEPFSHGTFNIAKTLAHLKATTIVGGGDSAAAAHICEMAHHMTHISTGGGASLEFLQGDRLPGLDILRNPRRS